MNRTITYSVMSPAELTLFKNRMEKLLNIRGARIDHPGMLQKLEDAGCARAGDTIRFPQPVIDRALASVPKTFTLYAPDEAYNMPFPHPQGGFYTRTCTGAPNYLPVDAQKRRVTLADAEEWFRLANEMEHIDYVALPSTCADGVPAGSIDISTLEKALQVSKKHIWIQPYGTENIKYLIDMCTAAGGAGKFREKPICSFISCSVPVLKFKYMDAEILCECAKAGIPVQPCALPAAGANTPVTAQGTALAACADVLAQIVMLQLLSPGLPVIATPLLFSMDMQTTYTLQSNTEITLGRLICMQAFEQGYGIPCHSYGTGTDSMLTDDAQNMIERTSLIHMMAMSDASVLGGAGQLETAKTIDPLMLIIDNEIFGIARRLRAGLAMDDEALDFEELLTGDDADGYLMSDHTLEHMRDAHRPELFFKGYLRDEKDESRTLLDRAREKYFTLTKKPKESILERKATDRVHAIALRATREAEVGT